ncbi:major facilitator superfamily transporter [Emericellopsis atlantica]|uniref:Major facilitator superfamily transporter n=1 Tax=Emericellopsis atlantica TaxID=2614577 RepID=A0A9P7ZQ34_9HYPO|nr:major facilitator superfamily transporter [Emericellopsis atlantica]KAG9256249.1 major facilitator superfamily transporter [Emericellopsis atlantica]
MAASTTHPDPESGSVPSQGTTTTDSLPPAQPAPFSDDNAAVLPSWKRTVILLVVCWMTLPVTFMSTSIMTVNPEIAATFSVPATAISTANAGVLVASASSALLWLPITTIIGRRAAYLVAVAVFILCSLGCALSDSMASFTTLWVLSGTTGPFFLVAGQTILSDIFDPAVRGTAVGFFLGSTVSAQSITPMISSIIGTFTSWRIIFGVQGAMALIGGVLAFFFIPKRSQLSNVTVETRKAKNARNILKAFNPSNIFRLYKFPGILLADLTCGFLAFNQYSLLASVRHIINPLFHLTSPMSSGLFYLAPGVGFLAGSVVAGHLSDRTVQRYKRHRHGLRLAEDRLNSSLPWFFVVLPLGTLLYGWSVDREVGGMGLPISASFIQGFGLMAAFNGLNTYAAEVHPEFKAAAISGKYLTQYCFGAVGVGGAVPLIDAVGVGWAFTITALSSLLGGCMVLFIARCLVRESAALPRPKFFDKGEAGLPQ